MSDSLRPHESQHARPPCPSPTPGVYSNLCPSSWWCHPAISSSVVPFSSYPQSLPASGSFPMSQLFAWGGQSTGVSASASVLPMYVSNTWEKESCKISKQRYRRDGVTCPRYSLLAGHTPSLNLRWPHRILQNVIGLTLGLSVADFSCEPFCCNSLIVCFYL